MNKLIIPAKMKAGFQNRSDTYTTKLAYVIYYDHKGVLRKEVSWENWRDKKIDPIDFPNDPMDGFVLNKNVGGYKSDWNYRSSKIRIYDPRGWEFEISLENLLFILKECDCSKGKGLEGAFVYAMDGKDLVLLPVNSESYKNSVEFSQLQTCKVKARDLIVGASYKFKDQQICTYLGRLMRYAIENPSRWGKDSSGMKHVFWDGKNFIFLKDTTSISVLNSDTIAPDFAELIDSYNNSVWGSKPVKFFTKEFTPRDVQQCCSYGDSWFSEQTPTEFLQCRSNVNRKYINGKYENSIDDSIVYVESRITLKDDGLHYESIGRSAYKDINMTLRNRSYNWFNRPIENNTFEKFVEATNLELWVELENGSKYKVTDSRLSKK